MRIVVTGVNGQVGWELLRTLQPLGDVISCKRQDVDLSSQASIQKFLDEVKPHLIVNPAAYTAVDNAEDDEATAYAVNALAPAAMAEWAQKHKASLVHFSTDYVFPGNATQAYLEDAPTGPLGIYGKTKLQGEKFVEEIGGSFVIFRASWVYAPRGKNFFLTMLRLAKEREQLRVVGDQVGCPSSARLLAETVSNVVAKGGEDVFTWLKEKKGVYHLASDDFTSWHGFASEIISEARLYSEIACKKIVPIRTDEYPVKAKRPAYSVLNATKAKEKLGVQMPSWKTQLKLTISEYFRA